jgi:hypothetical protein
LIGIALVSSLTFQLPSLRALATTGLIADLDPATCAGVDRERTPDVEFAWTKRT